MRSEIYNKRKYLPNGLSEIRGVLMVAACLIAQFNSGCKKFLEHLPDQRTELSTPEKVSELLTTAYPRGTYTSFAEAMSDNCTDNYGAATTAPVNTDPYYWRNVNYTEQDSPEYYWNACYQAIAAANQALAAIAEAPNPDDYTAQKGEALMCRAYCHFMLVTLFSKVYDPATAASDPGIPYVTVPETVVFGEYDRGTVADVYAQIEKDLTEGMPLIDDSKYKVPRYHFNRTAARAFATRFYLFKKDMNKVIENASAAFPGENWAANMRPWPGIYQDYSSTELSINYVKTSESANLLLASCVSRVGRYFFRYRYNSSEDLTKRITFNGYAAPNGNYTFLYKTWYQTSFRGIYYIRKFSEHFVYSSINATTGTAYTMIPLFTTEEVLLNRAEAFAALNDSVNALKDINIFLSMRIKNYSSSAALTGEKARTFYHTDDVSEALVKAVLDYKRPEFLHEGMRWFDLLRHPVKITHAVVDGAPVTLEPGDPRWVLQIPSQAAETIGENPR